MPKKVYQKPTPTPQPVEIKLATLYGNASARPPSNPVPFSPRDGREAELAAAMASAQDRLSTTAVTNGSTPETAPAPPVDPESAPPPETGLGARAGTFVHTGQRETAAPPSPPPTATAANGTFVEVDLGPEAGTVLAGTLPSSAAE